VKQSATVRPSRFRFNRKKERKPRPAVLRTPPPPPPSSWRPIDAQHQQLSSTSSSASSSFPVSRYSHQLFDIPPDFDHAQSALSLPLFYPPILTFFFIVVVFLFFFLLLLLLLWLVVSSWNYYYHCCYFSCVWLAWLPSSSCCCCHLVYLSVSLSISLFLSVPISACLCLSLPVSPFIEGHGTNSAEIRVNGLKSGSFFWNLAQTGWFHSIRTIPPFQSYTWFLICTVVVVVVAPGVAVLVDSIGIIGLL